MAGAHTEAGIQCLYRGPEEGGKSQMVSGWRDIGPSTGHGRLREVWSGQSSWRDSMEEQVVMGKDGLRK